MSTANNHRFALYLWSPVTQLTLLWTHLEQDACRENVWKSLKWTKDKLMWSSTASRVICFHMDQAFASELFYNLASCKILRIMQIILVHIRKHFLVEIQLIIALYRPILLLWSKFQQAWLPMCLFYGFFSDHLNDSLVNELNTIVCMSTRMLNVHAWKGNNKGLVKLKTSVILVNGSLDNIPHKQHRKPMVIMEG